MNNPPIFCSSKKWLPDKVGSSGGYQTEDVEKRPALVPVVPKKRLFGDDKKSHCEPGLRAVAVHTPMSSRATEWTVQNLKTNTSNYEIPTYVENNDKAYLL